MTFISKELSAVLVGLQDMPFRFIKYFLVGLCFIAFWGSASASHIRGGEITAKRRPGTASTFDFTLTIYRDSAQVVIDETNTLWFGDGTNQEVPYDPNPIQIPGRMTQVLVYRYSHTYGSPGQYKVYHYREFRNGAVVNIGATPGMVYFYVETQITLTPSLDAVRPNTSPILDAFAVDLAAVGQIYLHNPSAHDDDGDSLSYAIIPSRNYIVGTGASPIVNYQFPNAFAGGQDSARSGPASLTIDAKKGLFKWDVPNREGQYNVAIIIYEWRFGVQIGYVVRDMQIIVKDIRNKRPNLHIPADTCVIAGSNLKGNIRADDPDSLDKLIITSYGGPYSIIPLQFRPTLTPPSSPPVLQDNPAFALFSWSPGCYQVRAQTYDVNFKAEDRKPGVSTRQAPPLADIKTWSINVIGEAPQGLKVVGGVATISLSWDTYYCPNITGFNIYRRIDSSEFQPDTCTTGNSPESGYALIGNVEKNTLRFVDDNRGQGLKRGLKYCYKLTAVFELPTPVESRASVQECVSLLLNIPLLTNVSVLRTDTVRGQILVRHTRPRRIDRIRFPGPYRYQLKRSRLGAGQFTLIKSTVDLQDTTYIDTALNTDGVDYQYRVILFSTDNTGLAVPDSAGEDASNVIVEAAPSTRSITLTWRTQTPWSNVIADSSYNHTVYKKVGNRFDSLANVPGATSSYTDNGNGVALTGTEVYQYYVKTRGRYSDDTVPKPLLNDSYIVRAKLLDTIPPCPPQTLNITNDTLNCVSCAEYRQNPNRFNQLTWRLPSRDSCALDLKGFNIYYKAHIDEPFLKIATTLDTTFRHTNNGSLAGAYRITTLDSSGNESSIVDSVANDNCVSYELPNIFTPNRDELNPVFRPICATDAYIRSSKVYIYNRWGNLVYQSDGQKFSWDGKNSDGQDLPAAMYHFRAKVDFIRYRKEDEPATYKGWVEIVR